MKDLITTLQLIYVIAKTIHYNYKGDDFLSVHKYMDEITDEEAKPIAEKIIAGTSDTQVNTEWFINDI